MKKQKKIRIYKNGKLLKEKKDYCLVDAGIRFVQKPRKKEIITIKYFYTPQKI